MCAALRSLSALGAGLRREAYRGAGPGSQEPSPGRTLPNCPNCRSCRQGRVGVTRELGARLGCGRRVKGGGVARELPASGGVSEAKGRRAGAWPRS